MMRKLFVVTISLFALIVAACGTSQPGTPVPTVLGTEAAPQVTAAPAAPAQPPTMPHY